MCSAFCQIRNKLSKICQILVNFCQSGKNFAKSCHTAHALFPFIGSMHSSVHSIFESDQETISNRIKLFPNFRTTIQWTIYHTQILSLSLSLCLCTTLTFKLYLHLLFKSHIDSFLYCLSWSFFLLPMLYLFLLKVSQNSQVLRCPF